LSQIRHYPRGSLVRIVDSQRGVTKHQPQKEDWRWVRDQKNIMFQSNLDKISLKKVLVKHMFEIVSME